MECHSFASDCRPEAPEPCVEYPLTNREPCGRLGTTGPAGQPPVATCESLDGLPTCVGASAESFAFSCSVASNKADCEATLDGRSCLWIGEQCVPLRCSALLLHECEFDARCRVLGGQCVARDPERFCCDDGWDETVGDHQVALETNGAQCRGIQWDDGNPCTRDSFSAVGGPHAAVAILKDFLGQPGCPSYESCLLIVPCDDGNPCTALDRCGGPDGTRCMGSPTGAAPGVIAEGCQVLMCDAEGRAWYQPRPDAPCDDYDACTLPGRCTAVGICQAGPAVACEDNDPCTGPGSCTASDGCAFPPSPDGTPCSDGRPCSIDDSCLGSTCVMGTLQACDDGDEATTDHCDPVTGECVHRPAVPVAGLLPDVRVDFEGLVVPASVGKVKHRLPGTATFETVESIGWCPPAVADAKAGDDAPECGLGGLADPDCSLSLAPSCLLFDAVACPGGSCPPGQYHVVERESGRPPDAAVALLEAALAINARSLLGTPLDSAPIEATLGLWFALESVHGTHGLGRVTLFDTNASGDGGAIPSREWRIRLEIGHSLQACDADRQDSSGASVTSGCQAGRHPRMMNAWFAHGGEPSGSPTISRLLQLPLHDWTNRSWHHAAVVLSESELCLVLDGARRACTSRPPDFLPHDELPDYVYVLGAARPERPGLEDLAVRQVRVDNVEAFHSAQSPEDVALWFATGVPSGPSIAAGNLEVRLTDKNDGYGIWSITDRRTGQRLTATAPPRSLWSLRLVPRHDLHTSLYDPSPDVKAKGTPAAYAQAADTSPPGPFQSGRRADVLASPWSFFIDNLSVAVPDLPEVSSTVDTDGSTHILLHYHQVPLPTPTQFDDPSKTTNSDINLPPLLQDSTSGSGNDAYACEGPACPQAGFLESVWVHLWVVPGDAFLYGQIFANIESDYWSIAETEFPILDGVARLGGGDGGNTRLVVPDNNVGRDVVLPLALATCDNCGACSQAPFSCAGGKGAIDADGTCVGCDPPSENAGNFASGPSQRIYPSRHMSMPFLGVYDSDTEIGGLFLAVAGNRGRLSHFPIRRALATETLAGGTRRFVLQPEPSLRLSIVDVAEGAGEPGNDTTPEAWNDSRFALALQDGGWFNFAERYRSVVESAAWLPEPMAVRDDEPDWMTQSGYYATATRRDYPVAEANALAAVGLPADLQLTELRNWTRADAIWPFFGDQTNGNDSPFFGNTENYVLPDYDWARWALPANLRRFPAGGFSAMLSTDGVDPGGHWVRGGPATLYTNPALIDLGREWATPPALIGVFSRGTAWWPVWEAMLESSQQGERVRVEFGDPTAPLAFFSGPSSITHKSGKSAYAGVDTGAGPVGEGLLSFEAPHARQDLPDGEPPVNPQRDEDQPTSERTPRPDYRTDTCTFNGDYHYGCPGHPVFRSEVAEQLAKFGVLTAGEGHNHPFQGLYIDQVGTVAPRRCDSSAHSGPGGHRPGGGSYWTDGWRAILSQARSTIRTTRPDAGLYGEGFNEVLLGVQDGFLVLHDDAANMVPLAQAVYHDRAQFISRYTETSSEATALRDVVALPERYFRLRIHGWRCVRCCCAPRVIRTPLSSSPRLLEAPLSGRGRLWPNGAPTLTRATWRGHGDGHVLNDSRRHLDRCRGRRPVSGYNRWAARK